MGSFVSLLPLIVLIIAMYFLMIRPQRKKDKQIQEMRSSLQVGDEIVTIGGICGKIVKTKDETIVIQVGADKVKFEMMRWSVSSVTNPSHKPRKDEAAAVEEEEAKKVKPKKLKRFFEIIFPQQRKFVHCLFYNLPDSFPRYSIIKCYILQAIPI